uniref:coiled-coil domain-containing protein 166 n=1 Tax=Pristiophorus japonicus TaxID=55135 RepID=UPI00398E689B
MSKKKKTRAEGKSKVVGMELEVLTTATERIVLLQNEYDGIVKQHKQMKLKINNLRQENEFLEKEAQQTRLETQEYLAQMAKRTEKRQNQIISLNDQNHKYLEEIREEKEKIMTDFEIQKQELETLQMDKEKELLQLNNDIKELKEYKDLRQEQLARITELDKELMVARANHSQRLHDIKSNFNKDKAEYKQNTKRRVKLLESEANREAVCCLIKHIQSIKVENQQLREVLVCLIRRSRILCEQQMELEEQRSHLLREREYCTKLRTLRYKKQLHEYVEPEKEEAPRTEGEPEAEEQPKTEEEPKTMERRKSEGVKETEKKQELKQMLDDEPDGDDPENEESKDE